MPGGGGVRINIHKEVEIEPTIRTELLGSMFEIPTKQKLSVTLTGESEHDRRDYNIGLIVGPSGSGKTLILNSIFGTPSVLGWGHKSVIDDFPSSLSMEEISRVCSSVGFNTIPSWLRPYSVLSNGERFRAETARFLLGSDKSPITVDEFTSVVDRQVAQFACHSVQKYVRESGKKLVVASCHYDIIPWLQPDWLLEPGNPCRFTWRSLQSRPPINVSVSRVQYQAWNLVKEFHYLTQELNKAARCYGLFVHPSTTKSDSGLPESDAQYVSGRDNMRDGSDEDKIPGTQGRLASFCGVLHRPHPRVSDISGFTRMVTLPDFQGLGLAMVLANTVGSAYKAMGRRLHSYPNHPSWIRSYQRNKDWLQVKASGEFSPKRGATSTVGGFGGRRCAVFFYVGEAINHSDAERLIGGE
jgi:ABC-type lipoprotein export system ATPase subunit